MLTIGNKYNIKGKEKQIDMGTEILSIGFRDFFIKELLK